MTSVNTKDLAPSTNANEAAASTPKEINYLAIVEHNAAKKATGLTRESWSINRSRLFSACCAEVKSLRGQDRDSRLTPAEATALNETIDAFILSKIAAVTPLNARMVKRSFGYRHNEMAVVEKVNITGENPLALKEQKLGITLLIGAQQKRLDKLREKVTPDYDAEQNCEKMIAKLEAARFFIESQIEKQGELSK